MGFYGPTDLATFEQSIMEDRGTIHLLETPLSRFAPSKVIEGVHGYAQEEALPQTWDPGGKAPPGQVALTIAILTVTVQPPGLHQETLPSFLNEGSKTLTILCWEVCPVS